MTQLPGLQGLLEVMAGRSYGLHYHSLTRTRSEDVVVYNRIDHCIYGRFPFSDYSFNPNPSGRRILAESAADKLAHRLNGYPEVDLAGIDSTP